MTSWLKTGKSVPFFTVCTVESGVNKTLKFETFDYVSVLENFLILVTFFSWTNVLKWEKLKPFFFCTGCTFTSAVPFHSESFLMCFIKSSNKKREYFMKYGTIPLSRKKRQ